MAAAGHRQVLAREDRPPELRIAHRQKVDVLRQESFAVSDSSLVAQSQVLRQQDIDLESDCPESLCRLTCQAHAATSACTVSVTRLLIPCAETPDHRERCGGRVC